MPEIALAAEGIAPRTYLSQELTREPTPSPPRAGETAVSDDAATADAMSRIVDQLLSWYSNPSEYDDSDLESPSKTSIVRAIELATRLKESLSIAAHRQGFLPPLPRGVSIGSGGSISIEFARGPAATTFVVHGDGKTERIDFLDHRVKERSTITR